MNPDYRTIETADRTRHTAGIARSAATYFRRELEELTLAVQIAREHLAAHPDDEETRASLATLERQRQELIDGWQRSSVRRHVEERSGRAEVFALCEQRAVLAPAATGPAVEDRATATTSRTAKSLTGYAAVFDKWTDLGYFRERIAPGAFNSAIKTSDIRLLFNHNADHVFARTTSATLELAEDAHGLRFHAALLPFDGASYALARRVDRGDISGCSFSFTVAKDSWRFGAGPGGLDERTIEQIGELFDVGPVTYPAYPQTSVEAAFEDVTRAADPPVDADPPAVVTPRRLRPTPTPMDRVRELNLQSIEDELHDLAVDAVEDDLRELDRRRRVDLLRAAHLARHPGDVGRLDVPGGLVYARRNSFRPVRAPVRAGRF